MVGFMYKILSAIEYCQNIVSNIYILDCNNLAARPSVYSVKQFAY